VFTTRNLEAAIKHSSVNRVKVSKFSLEDTTELLKSNLGDISTTAEINGTRELLNVLEYLLLTIIQAAAYLCVKQISVIKYLQIYKDSSEALLEVLNRNIEDTRRYRTLSKLVITT
jgi:hypothetical protein